MKTKQNHTRKSWGTRGFFVGKWKKNTHSEMCVALAPRNFMIGVCETPKCPIHNNFGIFCIWLRTQEQQRLRRKYSVDYFTNIGHIVIFSINIINCALICGERFFTAAAHSTWTCDVHISDERIIARVSRWNRQPTKFIDTFKTHGAFSVARDMHCHFHIAYARLHVKWNVTLIASMNKHLIIRQLCEVLQW